MLSPCDDNMYTFLAFQPRSFLVQNVNFKIDLTKSLKLNKIHAASMHNQKNSISRESTEYRRRRRSYHIEAALLPAAVQCTLWVSRGMYFGYKNTLSFLIYPLQSASLDEISINLYANFDPRDANIFGTNLQPGFSSQKAFKAFMTVGWN